MASYAAILEVAPKVRTDEEMDGYALVCQRAGIADQVEGGPEVGMDEV
jgi:hypothetical protein